MEKILFVCTGNTCRSSMAEVLFEELVTDSQQEWEILSAGLAAVEGRPAAPEAVKVMERRGLDLSSHQTTPLTEKLVKEVDLILTMTRRHKISITNMYPQVESKVYTLKGYADRLTDEDRDQLDITDPYGQPIATYQECASEIEQELKKIIKNLNYKKED